MLSVMDRRLRAWHFWLANALAIGWFAGMTWATQAAIPGVKFFRCPFGLCLGYYTPGELTATFTRIGKSGREFLTNTLLPDVSKMLLAKIAEGERMTTLRVSVAEDGEFAYATQ